MDRGFIEPLLNEGLSLAAIADRLGVDRSTVGKAARRHGLAVPGREKYAPKRIDPVLLAARVKAGATQRELASDFGVSVVTIQRHLGRHGLRTRARTRRVDRLADDVVRESERACVVHGQTTFCLDARGSWRCLSCRSEAVARRRRKVKETLVEEAGGACVLCGYSRCARALHFHHLDPANETVRAGAGRVEQGYRHPSRGGAEVCAPMLELPCRGRGRYRGDPSRCESFTRRENGRG